MSRRDEYRAELRALGRPEWEGFLRTHSGLPGPRGNLELMEAVADEGDEAFFRRLLAAGAETGEEYLVVCGLVGLGRLLAEGREDVLPELRAAASDGRWRVREGVVFALQRLGDRDPAALLAVAEGWATGNRYEQRTAAAAVCEPRLLRERAHVLRTLALLDAVTASLAAAPPGERRDDAFRVLRKGLGYCWSVAVAAGPEDGKPRFERWFGSGDRDVDWIVRENLRKARLARVAPEWTSAG